MAPLPLSNALELPASTQALLTPPPKHQQNQQGPVQALAPGTAHQWQAASSRGRNCVGSLRYTEKVPESSAGFHPPQWQPYNVQLPLSSPPPPAISPCTLGLSPTLLSGTGGRVQGQLNHRLALEPQTSPSTFPDLVLRGHPKCQAPAKLRDSLSL